MPNTIKWEDEYHGTNDTEVLQELFRQRLYQKATPMTDSDIRLSEELRQVYQIAETEVKRQGRQAIEPEHLLVGILTQPNCEASAVLQSVCLDVHQLLIEIRGVLCPGPGATSPPYIQTPEAKTCLEAAIANARNNKDGYVGTLHLLVGIVTTSGLGTVVTRGMPSIRSMWNWIKEVRNRLTKEGAAKDVLDLSKLPSPVQIDGYLHKECHWELAPDGETLTCSSSYQKCQPSELDKLRALLKKDSLTEAELEKLHREVVHALLRKYRSHS